MVPPIAIIEICDNRQATNTLPKSIALSPDALAGLDATLPQHPEAPPRQACSLGVGRVRVPGHPLPRRAVQRDLLTVGRILYWTNSRSVDPAATVRAHSRPGRGNPG